MKARDTMPKRGKLVQAYNKGGEEFRKYVLRYGEIVKDKKWEEEGIHVRLYHIHIDGLRAEIKMRGGMVERYGYGIIKQ